MGDLTEFIHTAHLNQQATQLIVDSAPLQLEIIKCMREIAAINKNKRTEAQQERVRHLRDTIFGYKIELDAIRIRSKRLHAQARKLRAEIT